MKISRRLFFVITFLFLLLPVSVHWRLLLFGKHTKGIVVDRNLPIIENHYVAENIDTYSIIRFEAEGRYVEFNGPENIDYPIGKELIVFYSKKNPKKYILLNFYGLFLSNKMILPIILFIFWISFYLTIRQNQHKIPTNRRF